MNTKLDTRGVFRALPNIFDRTFSAFSCWLHSEKKFIIDGLLIRLMIRFLISYSSCWGASHPFPLLRLSTSRRYTNQVFLNSATPSQITTNDIYISSQVIFFIVWSHQSAVTNSMHFQSTYIPHLQHLQSDIHMESSQASAVGPFLKKKSICWGRWLFSQRSFIVDAQ